MSTKIKIRFTESRPVSVPIRTSPTERAYLTLGVLTLGTLLLILVGGLGGW
jgi:hypothetical protein